MPAALEHAAAAGTMGKVSKRIPTHHPGTHCAILVILNLCIVLPWLGVEWLNRMDSIEGVFIGIARHRLEAPAAGGWFPFWYLGIPFEITYPPLLPGLTALAAWIAGLSPARAYHIITGLAYALGPASLYWLLRRLGSSGAAAMAGGLAYSLLAPAAFLMPSVANDLGSVWLVRRFHNLSTYGEGPHIVALTLLFAALALLDRALEKSTPARYFAAAIGIALVPLTNWLGAFALAWGALAITMASARPVRSIPKALIIGIWAYGFAVLWLPPGVIETVRWNSQADSAAPMGSVQLTVLLASILGLSVFAWFLGRRGVAKPWRFVVLFGPPLALLPLAEEHLSVVLIPRSLRYHLELEAVVIIVAVFLVSAIAAKLPAPARKSATAVCVVLTAVQAVHLHPWVREQSRPVDIESTIEHAVARQLAENHPGERVFSVGSVRFWMAAFADVPQFGGGFKHGVGFRQWWVIDYGLHFFQGHPELLVDWLRAYGVDILYAGEKGTREQIKPSPDAEKYRGLLPELWRDGGDVLYRIPRRGGHAHVIPKSAVVTSSPQNVLDAGPMRRYVAALEDPSSPPAAMTWDTPESARIAATVGPGDVISVQMAHHPRWKATANGVQLNTSADQLGMLIVEPASDGKTRIHLEYESPNAPWTLWIIAWLAALAAFVIPRRPLLKKPAHRGFATRTKSGSPYKRQQPS